MSSRKILVLNGHPGQSSLSSLLSQTYADAAVEGGHDVRQHSLNDMAFDMDNGTGGYQATKALEPDLEAFLSDLEWADHIVIATPLWWGAVPAKLKGLIDRSFLPGRAFDTRNTNRLGLPRPMLTGKTARVLMTSDTPALFLRLFYHNAVRKVLSRQILGFVGIRPTRFSQFAPASHPKDGQVSKWTRQVARLGTQAA
ncbi:MAG: NAD(P)H-dependent oxidoreductase [Rhodobacteraceae bacterium]|nr:NAD(P)H-dependent oxidoreductase [Paracoccaceae bacterium]